MTRETGALCLVGIPGMEIIVKKSKRLITGTAVLVLVASTLLAGCGYDDTSKDITKINVNKYVTSIGDYKNLTIDAPARDTITDAEVSDYIDYVLSGQSETVKSDKTVVEEGDIVNIDYEGIKDGVAFEGGTAQGYDLTIGSGTFIPGFEDGLIGHKVGEEVALDITFPENYGATELAGQAVVFNVKINYISENKVPELTDEIIAGYGLENVTNEEEYRAYVNENLQMAADNNHLASKRDAIQNALIEQCTFADLTGLGLYQFYVDQIKGQTQQMANNYGVSLEEVVSVSYGISMDEYEANVAEQAETLTKGALACAKVAKEEKITLSDEEFEQQIATDAADYGYESIDEFKAAINAEDYRNYLLQMKVVDKLLETATVNEATE